MNEPVSPSHPGNGGDGIRQPGRAPSWFDGLVRRLSERRVSVRTPLATWLAAAIFIGVIVVAIAAFPYDAGSVHWTRLAWTAVVLVPATAILNGLEFHLGAHLLSLNFTLAESFRVGLYGSAANNLPIPGAVMVRVGAMARRGSKLRRAGSVAVATGILRVALAAAVAGLVVWVADSQFPGLALMIFGGALGAVTLWYLSRSSDAKARWTIVSAIVAVEVAFVVATALRFHVALLALDVRATASQSVVLALSVSVAAAVGIVPAGLGIRELVAGLLAPLVSIQPALGLAGSVLDRIAAMIALGLITIVVAATQERNSRQLPPQSEAIE